jgi:hypothetical protein
MLRVGSAVVRLYNYSFGAGEKSVTSKRLFVTKYYYLGSGLIDYNQKMTMAAMQIADMNV